MGERKGSFGSRTKLDSLCQRPEPAAGISELIRGFAPTPTDLGARAWRLRKPEAPAGRPELGFPVQRPVGSSAGPPCLRAAPGTEGTEVRMPSDQDARGSGAGDTQPAVAPESHNGVVRRRKWKAGLL